MASRRGPSGLLDGDTFLHDRLLSYAALVPLRRDPLTRDTTIVAGRSIRSYPRVLRTAPEARGKTGVTNQKGLTCRSYYSWPQ
jgi:hypothetical protein